MLRTLKLGHVGRDVEAYKRAVHRCLQTGELKTLQTQPRIVRRTFGLFFRTRVKQAQKRLGLPQSGVIGPATAKALDPFLDMMGRALLDQHAGRVPDLGPVMRGGKPVLDHDLTHATSGIPLYPAFDDAFAQGIEVIAPEDLTVTEQSSSRPGDAFYAQGKSGIRYWFGHLAGAPANGRHFAKGQTVGIVGPNTIGGGPHVHVGLNVELVWGPRKQLQHRTDYRHGAPTVGDQLRRGNV